VRKLIIAGNWKMHKSIPEAIELANGLKRELFDLQDSIDIVICPAFTALSEASEIIIDSNISLGAQDVYWQPQGAFTGEVSAPMLKDAGAKYVIIGHSERRQYFGETNVSVNKKIKAAFAAGLLPIVCVGENLAERENNKTFAVLDDHVQNGLKDINEAEISRIVIAYEPVWAIGTGKTATSQQAQEAHEYIRNLIIKLYNKDIAENLRIQYGGSVKPENTQELVSCADVDGALVGGASLSIDSFAKIVKLASKVKK
jgi:triosephosphate isomerase